MKQNIQILQAMLLMADSLNYSSTYKQQLIDEIKTMLDKEQSGLHNKNLVEELPDIDHHEFESDLN